MTNFSKRFERPIEFLQQRLSSESYAGAAPGLLVVRRHR